ncbi:MAG: amino acid carrier protein [Holosporales bacterium]|nr:amino acid carrier protein [Holosporales bacterium]
MWGWPLIIAICCIGIYFTITLGMFRISRLKMSVKSIAGKEECHGDISVFGSLCTSISSTIGTGNIVGIAVAVSIGGPGAIFWLWVSSIFSFAIKYAEGVLAIKYRKFGKDGTIAGGPMYYIEIGLQKNRYSKALAKVFAFFGMIVTLLGTGTFAQSNSIASALQSFGFPTIATTIILGIIVSIITLKGIKSISAVSEKLVPIMAVFYIGSALLIIILNINSVPQVFCLIFKSAFSPESALGGGVGVSIAHVVSVGVRRGIFSHECGLGSAAIASAAAKTKSPARQGFVAMAGAIVSVIVCSMTGIVLIITCNDTLILSASCQLKGALLTSQAFGYGLGIVDIGKYIVGIGIILFAFTSIIGWNYYGEKFTQYLFGDKAIVPFKILYIAFVVMGPYFSVETIFTIADILTGFMAVTNLIGVVGLRKVVSDETEKFFRDMKVGQ